MIGGLSVLAVFVAGVLSFASPCVAALVPAYVSYISGLSVAELDQAGSLKRIVVNGLLFCFGFSLVFIALGASASVFGGFLAANKVWLARIGGIFLIIFGLNMLGVIRIPLLGREARPIWGKLGGGRYLQAPLVGMSFAVGWTPCLGPILAAVLTFASQTVTVAQGALLLAVYSAGLAIPFMVVAAALSKGLELSFMKKHARGIQVASGVLLVLFGVLVASGQLILLTARLSYILPRF